ncbi:MAG: FtsQ-type POTRA domain-containing protein [Ruminococcaceae bacterium]|nr:FtsQ-type POTRA domain-containing protein [Oscillospiraceae bacterium]
MNRTVFTEAYFQERKECRNIASNTVMQHSLKSALKKKIVKGILVSSILLVLFGTLLLVLPAFKVKSIHVEGAQSVAEESVISASGVSIGDEILELNKDEIINRIAKTEGVESVSVRTSLSGISIEITEK